MHEPLVHAAGRAPVDAGARPALLSWLIAAAVAGCGGSGDDVNVSGPMEAARCEPPPESRCAVEGGERLPLEVTGTTAGREDGYGGASCGLGGDAVADVAVRWTAPRDGTYHIRTEGTDFDSLLSVRMGSCAGREIACNDDAAEGVGHSAMQLELAACRTITMVVDGRGVEEVGAFRLTVHGTEQVCDDGADDDGDGLTDCDDPDCFGPECPGEDSWRPAWGDLEWVALEEVNARRAEGGSCGGEDFGPAPALEMNRALRRAARLHSQDMADNRYFSHDSLDGRTVADRAEEADFRGSGPLGENILQDSNDAAEAVAGWMSSPEHCENIMNPTFRVTGIGYAEGAGGSRWTQDFATSH